MALQRNLETEKAACKQVNGEAAEREEPLTVITQFLGSEKIPLITRENRKINTQKIGKEVEHIT